MLSLQEPSTGWKCAEIRPIYEAYAAVCRGKEARKSPFHRIKASWIKEAALSAALQKQLGEAICATQRLSGMDAAMLEANRTVAKIVFEKRAALGLANASLVPFVFAGALQEGCQFAKGDKATVVDLIESPLFTEYDYRYNDVVNGFCAVWRAFPNPERAVEVLNRLNSRGTAVKDINAEWNDGVARTLEDAIEWGRQRWVKKRK